MASLELEDGRNPEALLDRVALIAWAGEMAIEAGHRITAGLRQARDAGRAALMALRHADGGLPRFHGGDAGTPGRLAQLGQPGPSAAPATALGFARLAAGDCTLVCDLAAPPEGPHSHASPLAFEFTAGPQPLITGCGSGRRLGGPWAEAGRATAAHSALCLDGLSAARLEGGALTGRPAVRVDALTDTHVDASHDGWGPSHGLTHHRRLTLGDGVLQAEDWLAPGTDRPVSLHFHLHPAIRVTVEGEAALLHLPDGRTWRLEQEGATLRVAPSARLDPAAEAPMAAQQVVLGLSGMRRPLAWRLVRLG